ncbi:hypothetical protein [Aquimarina sediminis]|uniref:hypothetical protein n=1 Tax=Aquimarina sediminis TaxID=2070536 RepID=UPI000FFEE02D|nr:hypothetical protein [Aquimarina sediminis]
MKYVYMMILIGILIQLTACKGLNAKMYPNKVPDEYDAIKMKVKGLDGWMPNRNVTYGEYEALKIKRGWTKGSEALLFPDINVNTEKSQKTRFTQKTADGKMADVHLLEICTRKGFELQLGDIFEIDNTNGTHFFMGTITPQDSLGNKWSFIQDVANYNHELQITDQKGNKMTLEGNTFRLEDKIIAGYQSGVFEKNWTAFSTYIWIKEDVLPEHKLVVASMLTALLSRERISCSQSEE